MTTLFEVKKDIYENDLREEGRTQGRIEGKAEEIIETGYEFELSENQILERLQKKLDISSQKAKKYLEMFGK